MADTNPKKKATIEDILDNTLTEGETLSQEDSQKLQKTFLERESTWKSQKKKMSFPRLLEFKKSEIVSTDPILQWFLKEATGGDPLKTLAIVTSQSARQNILCDKDGWIRMMLMARSLKTALESSGKEQYQAVRTVIDLIRLSRGRGKERGGLRSLKEIPQADSSRVEGEFFEMEDAVGTVSEGEGE